MSISSLKKTAKGNEETPILTARLTSIRRDTEMIKSAYDIGCLPNIAVVKTEEVSASVNPCDKIQDDQIINIDAHHLNIEDGDLTNKLPSEVNMDFCTSDKIANVDIEVPQIQNSEKLLPFRNSNLIDIKEEVNEMDIKTEVVTEEFDLTDVKYETDHISYHNEEFQQPMKKNKIIKTKKYPCPVCQKNFAYPRSRSKHFIYHFGEHNAEYGKFSVGCFTCGKTFFTKKEIVEHLFVHLNKDTMSTKIEKLDPKPYRCVICAMEFFKNTHLQNHMKLHSEAQIRSVRLDLYFQNNSMNLHSGGKPYKCPICKKEYTRKMNFVKHVKHSHKVDLISKQ